MEEDGSPLVKSLPIAVSSTAAEGQPAPSTSPVTAVGQGGGSDGLAAVVVQPSSSSSSTPVIGAAQVTAPAPPRRNSGVAGSVPAEGNNRRTSGDQHSLWKNRKLDLQAFSKDVCALGLTIVIGGQYFAWNYGLVAGFGSYAIATALISTGYYTLCLCLAEMTSAMPFAGGAYGFARVTMGTFAGFLVGCCESLEYIAYVSAAVLGFGQMITIMTELPVAYEPIWWAVFFILALGVLIMGGKNFWRFNLVCAVLITVIPVLYCFLVIPQLDASGLAWSSSSDTTTTTTEPYFRGGLVEFLTVLPLASWFYVGVEALPLAAEEVHDVKTNLPRGIVACVSTLVVTCFGLLLTVSCGAGGVALASTVLLPLNQGFATAFGLPASWHHLMTAFTLPSAWATGTGFIFVGGRQMFAMARSGLFPSIFTKTRGSTGVPYMAFILSSIVSALILVLAWLVPAVALATFQICIASAYATYLTQLYSYVTLLKHYPNIQRSYKSPLGMYGAYCSAAIFSLALLASLAFQPNAWITPTVLCSYIIGVSLYYWLYARHHQIISPEEEAVMFIAYVVKNNMMKARKKKGKNRLGSLVQPVRKAGSSAVAHKPDPSSPSAAGRKSSISTFEDFRDRLRSGRSGRVSSKNDSQAATIGSSGAMSPLSPSASFSSPRSGGTPSWGMVLLYNILNLAFTRYRVVVDVDPQAAAAVAAEVSGDAQQQPGGGEEMEQEGDLNSNLTGTIRIVPDRRGVHEIIKAWFRKHSSSSSSSSKKAVKTPFSP